MKVLSIAAILTAFAGSAFAQRLPADPVPVHYDIRVEPDLAAATFAGEETIVISLKAPATAIVLNAAEIAFGAVRIAAAGRTQTATVTLDAAKDQATFTVPQPVPPGEARIQITYKGILNGDLRGLYLSKANNRRYAVTQLEATDARRMFPSFDEPAFKATYTVTAVIDAKDHAISNGAVVSDTPGPRPGTHTIAFEKTPKMSSYLLALAVGDFVCNEGAADNVPIRICSTPDKKSLTDFALESTEAIVKYYNRYYTIKYPFKKLDVVAVPDFSAGAMENTGAIFYRETLLLAGPDAAVATRRSIAEVLAHEIAHQWFGDLVTMEWWDDIWLNEGFATWMQSKPLKDWKPEWHVELKETADNQKAMGLDALHATRPIRARANTPQEINELFDPIAYEKGAAVLRMIESWVGEAPFQKAVNDYVGRHQYGNARAEDFWSTVAASTGKPVDRVMHTFVDQAGLPLVSLAARCAAGRETLTLGQSRYTTDAAAGRATAAPLWNIPVCLQTAAGRQSCTLLEQRQQTVTLDACQAWAIGNAGGRGYYRTALDPAALTATAANVAKLSAPERLTVLSDAWALVLAGASDVGAYLGLASGFQGENSDLVLVSLTASLHAIDTEFATAATRPAFRSFVARLLGPTASKYGWDAARGAVDDNARTVRAVLLRQLGQVQDPAALATARQLVDQELAKPNTGDRTLLDVAVSIAAASGDAKLYEQYWSRAQAAVVPEERYRFLYGLTAFTDPALIRRTVDLALGPDVRSQDTKLVLANLLGNGEARDLVWDLMRERWAAVQKKTGEFVGNTVIVGALGSFCDARHAGEIKTFFAAHPVPDAARTLTQTLERIDTCTRLSASQTAVLTEYLKTRANASGIR